MTPQKEYIIDDGMLTQWRVGCIRAMAPFSPDGVCHGCEFDNKERRGCDFDDDVMQSIFQSRPYPAKSEQEIREKVLDIIEAYKRYRWSISQPCDGGYIAFINKLRKGDLDLIIKRGEKEGWYPLRKQGGDPR